MAICRKLVMSRNGGAPNKDDLGEIDKAASKITIQGARYPEALEKRTGL